MKVQTKGAVLSLTLASVNATIFNSDNCVKSFEDETFTNMSLCKSIFAVAEFMFLVLIIRAVKDECFGLQPRNNQNTTSDNICMYGPVVCCFLFGCLAYLAGSSSEHTQSLCVHTM